MGGFLGGAHSVRPCWQAIRILSHVLVAPLPRLRACRARPSAGMQAKPVSGVEGQAPYARDDGTAFTEASPPFGKSVGSFPNNARSASLVWGP